VQRVVSGHQDVLALDVTLDDAIGRADHLALRAVLGTDAFGASTGVDEINHVAGSDGVVRAHGDAGVTAGAVIGNLQRHGISSPLSRPPRRAHPDPRVDRG
jgi:hypothetical protein